MSDSLTLEQLYVLKRQIDDLKAINTYIKANRDGKLPKKKRPTTAPTIIFRADQSVSTKKRGRPSISNSKRNLVRIVSDDRESSEQDVKDDDGGGDDEEEDASSDGEEDDAVEEVDVVLPSGSASDGSDFKLENQCHKELVNKILPQRTLPARKRRVKSFRELLTTDEEDDDGDDDDQGLEEEEVHNGGGQPDSDGNNNDVGIESSLDEEDADAAAILLTTVNVATTTAGGGGGGVNQVEPGLEGV